MPRSTYGRPRERRPRGHGGARKPRGEETVADFAKTLWNSRKEIVDAEWKTIFSSQSLEERRALMTAQLGADFVLQLRRADDWFYEALLRGDEDDDEGLGDVRRTVFCLHAAHMTNDCHGELWPHLKFGNFKKILSAEESFEYCIGLATQYDAHDEADKANRVLGFTDPRDAVPPRETGSLDLDVMEKVARPCAVCGIKAGILSGGGFVAVERRDEKAAVLLQTRGVRKDTAGSELLEVLYMWNTRESFQKPGSLQPHALRAMQADHGKPPLKIVCEAAELAELKAELLENAKLLSAACHMSRREAFAKGKEGEAAVKARVEREELELSFLRLSKPKSSRFLAALQLKEQGNERFREGGLGEAERLYEEALRGLQACSEETEEEEGRLHSNLAECFLRQARWAAAASAATAALQLDKGNVKALFRRAKAREALGENRSAVADLRAVVGLEPGNRQAGEMLSRLSPEQHGSAPSARQEQRAGTAGQERGATRTAAQAVSELGELPEESKKPDAWAKGLSPAMQRDWFMDCYRMRVDDRYVHGGEERGLYADNATGDFLLFCKLAARRDAVPRGWDWGAFVKKARGLLQYAFEKADAQEKYGGENVFAVATGGRSLRYTAELIFDSSILATERSDVEKAVARELRQATREQVYAEVGGLAVWREAGLVARG